MEDSVILNFKFWYIKKLESIKDKISVIIEKYVSSDWIRKIIIENSGEIFATMIGGAIQEVIRDMKNRKIYIE